ncbi:MAG TPA: hypothetical protein VK390_09600 [Propionibacteriaceae bacterium]|nr:hypothetical protein [Propionibacteriaceae bacterium]
MHTYAQRYTPLLSAMQEDLQEFHAAGTISRARHLAQVTGQHFNADQLPQYFTGDPDGPVVLVHLNPKQATAPDQIPGWLTTARTLEDYFDACRHFGARMYGPSSPRTHQSPFDHKQIRFLQPLGVIDFVQGAPPRRPLHQSGTGGGRQAATRAGPLRLCLVLGSRLHS